VHGHGRRTVRRPQARRKRVERDVAADPRVESRHEPEVPEVARGECADVGEPHRKTRRRQALGQEQEEVLLDPLGAAVDLVERRDLPRAFEEDRVARAAALDVASPDQARRERAIAGGAVGDGRAQAVQVARLLRLRVLEEAVRELARPAPRQEEARAAGRRVDRAAVDVPPMLVRLLAVEDRPVL